MKKMMKDMLLKVKEQKGATAVEYGLMVAAIAAVIVTTVSLLGGTVNSTFDGVQKAIAGL